MYERREGLEVFKPNTVLHQRDLLLYHTNDIAGKGTVEGQGKSLVQHRVRLKGKG